MAKRRVVVTGLGIVSPVGNDVKTAWENVVAGRSGIGPITDFDVSAFSTRFGGCVKDFDVEKYIPAKEARKVDPFVHYGIAAAEQAVKAAEGMGMQEADILVRGPGPGREAAIRALTGMGLTIRSISDVTTVPHNGCRPPKKRRV